MNIPPTKLFLSLAAAIALAGCANYRASGRAPGSVSGTARSESSQQKDGEFYNTETLAPGVGSALFPDPGWR
jgi:uncharacterized lipoprotein YbaY